jgi:hypothetical protein
LGKIDDVDFTYFNGKLVGQMGQLPPDYETKWNVDRAYTIKTGWINWDQPNTIAVRVFDLVGGGGIYSCPVQFSARGLSDYIEVEPVFTRPDQIITGGAVASLTVNLVNQSKTEIPGKIKIKVVSDFKQEITVNTTELVLEKKKIQSPPDSLTWFADFWKATKKELASVDPQYKVTKINSLSTEKRNVYLVEMHSLGNIRIRGYLSKVAAREAHSPMLRQHCATTG